MNDLTTTAHPLHDAQAAFVTELARRLHVYGTSAQRLEGAVSAVARRLGVECEIWSNPTGLILSFADPERGGLYSQTRVIRLEPGDENLGRLAATDAIAEDVLAGRRDVESGYAALRALDKPPRRHANALQIFSFGLASAAVAGLLRSGWDDLATAACVGWVIGAITVLGASRPRLRDAHEALSALVATVLVAAVATFITPLALQSVIVASLIVLMPGLTLTTAVAELTSQHLVSGTARFAGALTVLLKLTFGTVAGMYLVELLGWKPMVATGLALPAWASWLTLLTGSFAFAVLFRASRRDTLLVMASVWLGYAAIQLAQQLPGAAHSAMPAGPFFAAIVVAAVANAYGRWSNRPGALVRVPGIILLVPGSVGFRSLNFVLERDVMLGMDTGFALLSALIALVAGLLFGNLLVPPRRNL